MERCLRTYVTASTDAKTARNVIFRWRILVHSTPRSDSWFSHASKFVNSRAGLDVAGTNAPKDMILKDEILKERLRTLLNDARNVLELRVHSYFTSLVGRSW